MEVSTLHFLTLISDIPLILNLVPFVTIILLMKLFILTVLFYVLLLWEPHHPSRKIKVVCYTSLSKEPTSLNIQYQPEIVT
jgi:hypothetical protein